MRPSELTKPMRWQIADRLREERLDEVNAACVPVQYHETFYTRYGKRFLDILIALCCVLVTLPINLIIATITFFDVGRPIFFRQQRVGKDEKLFTIYKFRNMTTETDAEGNLLPPSQRITKFGHLMRKTSLDELLNFWSILKGDMSVIGPRPLVPEYLPRYSNRHRMRFCVRPGLECPPHAKGQSVDTWQERFENDVWYVEHISFLTDCKLCFQLVALMLDRKHNAIRADVTRVAFMGYSEDGRAIDIDEIPPKYLEQY